MKHPFVFVYFGLYLALLLSYFFSETSGNFKRRAINKILMACMFFGFALVTYLQRFSFFSWQLLVLIGLLFAFWGDIVLLWNFGKGGMLFGIGNIFIVFYELYLWIHCRVSILYLLLSIAVFAVLFGGGLEMNKRGIVPFVSHSGKKYTAYLASVTVHGSLGLALAVAVYNPAIRLFGIGLLLMMISDYFLTVYECHGKKNWILRTNSAFYFVGVASVALSLLYH